MKMKTQQPKPMGHCKSRAKGKVHNNRGLPQEQEKSQINNLTLHLKQLGMEELENPRVSRSKEIFKIRNKCKRNKRDHSKNQQSQKLVL